jgi:hypothetical protein
MKQAKTNTAQPVSLPRRSIQIGVSLRPDRVTFLKQTAEARGVSVSEIVRDLVDEARKQAERKSRTA